MCTKLELFAKSGIENEYYLEDNLRCETTSSMTLNNATLFWHYKNVRKNVKRHRDSRKRYILLSTKGIGRSI